MGVYSIAIQIRVVLVRIQDICIYHGIMTSGPPHLVAMAGDRLRGAITELVSGRLALFDSIVRSASESCL